jgi:hypothetical protein
MSNAPRALAEMEREVPWSALVRSDRADLSEAGLWPSPVGAERMPRIYFLQNGSTCRPPARRRRFIIRGRYADGRARAPSLRPFLSQRDRKFESSSLQRRVHKPSVPPAISPRGTDGSNPVPSSGESVANCQSARVRRGQQEAHGVEELTLPDALHASREIEAKSGQGRPPQRLTGIC